MANLAITQLTFPSAYTARSIQLGEVCAQFDVVYQNETDKKYWLADALTAAKAKAAYILLHGGGADAWVAAIPFAGTIIITSTPTLIVNTQYVISATGGKMAPKVDLLSGQFLTDVFLGKSATEAALSLRATGQAMP